MPEIVLGKRYRLRGSGLWGRLVAQVCCEGRTLGVLQLHCEPDPECKDIETTVCGIVGIKVSLLDLEEIKAGTCFCRHCQQIQGNE